MTERYIVYFTNEAADIIGTDNKEAALHYAKMNAGTVKDTETGEIIAAYSEDYNN